MTRRAARNETGLRRAQRAVAAGAGAALTIGAAAFALASPATAGAVAWIDPIETVLGTPLPSLPLVPSVLPSASASLLPSASLPLPLPTVSASLLPSASIELLPTATVAPLPTTTLPPLPLLSPGPTPAAPGPTPTAPAPPPSPAASPTAPAPTAIADEDDAPVAGGVVVPSPSPAGAGARVGESAGGGLQLAVAGWRVPLIALAAVPAVLVAALVAAEFAGVTLWLPVVRRLAGRHLAWRHADGRRPVDGDSGTTAGGAGPG